MKRSWMKRCGCGWQNRGASVRGDPVMKRDCGGAVILLAVLVCSCGDRNPAAPPINGDTTQTTGPGLGAGASLNGRLPFPADNPWNRDVSNEPVDANSAALIASCGLNNLHPDFGTVWNGAPNGIPYIV